MEQSNEELIAACREGDEAAWCTLVARYQRLIFAIARRTGLDKDLAADVCQQVFTALVDNLDHIRQPEQINAWLVTSARREALRLWRIERDTKERIDTEDVSEGIYLELPDSSPLADEVLLKLETQHRVRYAVESLDERCRKLLIMLFYLRDTPSYSEIATLLDISEGSIGPTRARCLEKLQRSLYGQKKNVF